MASVNGDNHQPLGVRTTSMEEVCFQSPKIGKPNYHQSCAPQAVSSERLQCPVILFVVWVNTIVDVLPQEMLSLCYPSGWITQVCMCRRCLFPQSVP